MMISPATPARVLLTETLQRGKNKRTRDDEKRELFDHICKNKSATTMKFVHFPLLRYSRSFRVYFLKYLFLSNQDNRRHSNQATVVA